MTKFLWIFAAIFQRFIRMSDGKAHDANGRDPKKCRNRPHREPASVFIALLGKRQRYQAVI